MLTEEQQKVVDYVCSDHPGDKILMVNAIAGSGKTSTCNAVIRAYKPKSGFYTAFNKGIVTDSAKRFGDLIECRTLHSLAYRACRPRREIEPFTYKDITENLSYQKKDIIIKTMDDFYLSASLDVYDYVDKLKIEPMLKDLICKYVEKMVAEEVHPTFNFLLKHLHWLLDTNTIHIEKDLICLDECQDTSAVALEIFKLIQAKKKICLGDKFQNIYSFMNTVNAFDLLENTITLKLTRSFRCVHQVADLVDKFGKKHLEKEFEYHGVESVDDTKKIPSIVYLAKTNITLIQRMIFLMLHNHHFKTLRPIQDLFALPNALLAASAGKQVFDKEYKYLEDEYVKWFKMPDKGKPRTYFQFLAQNEELPYEVNQALHLLRTLPNGMSLEDFKAKVYSMNDNPDRMLSTAHAFKGLEANQAYIEFDLNRAVQKSSGGEEIDNLYYVALSRARKELINQEF